MTKGIIIAVPEKYQQICLNNLLNMRLKMGITLPIEIWQIGEEISANYLESYNNGYYDYNKELIFSSLNLISTNDFLSQFENPISKDNQYFMKHCKKCKKRSYQ